MKIDANTLSYKELNELIKNSDNKKIEIFNLTGQRYIGSGATKGKEIIINGVPGNDVGSFLDGAKIEILSDSQDATGDTMDEGEIIIHGSSGDATGYAMRGGQILIHGSSGYRTGIHMKEYKDKVPLIVIGNEAGSFLGEYQAGGIIIVLGLNCENRCPVGFFTGTGMHGGSIILRTKIAPVDLPDQVKCKEATEENKLMIKEKIKSFCFYFNEDIEKIMDSNFFILEPNSNNPYKRLYTPI